MPETRLNCTREKRITDEIVVDCYTPEERAMGWYCYLEGRLSFPFTARCIATRSISPLRKGEKAEVVAMAREEDCLAEMFVLVAFADRQVGVPLAQLRVVKADRDTREAVEDWHYWLSRGYSYRNTVLASGCILIMSVRSKQRDAVWTNRNFSNASR